MLRRTITGIAAPSGTYDGGASPPPFPQPLTPFEYYYLLEDLPGYPSEFPITLQSRGHLDRGAFSRAFLLTLERHPLLTARIESDGTSWPRWTADRIPAIRWDDTSHSLRSCVSTARCPGVQMEIIQHGDVTEWKFLFHHVAVDGMGAFLFIADLFVAHAHLCSRAPGPIPWRRLDAERLRDRDGHQLFNQRPGIIDILRIGSITLPIQTIRAAVVSEHGQGSPTLPPSGAGCAADDLVNHLSQEETAELSRIAGSLGVMLNDLLLRDYFLTLADWNRGTAEDRRPIRVLLPTNMRRREDYRMSAANVFSFTFLSRRLPQCADRTKLLGSLRDEIRLIKRQKRGLYFEAGLRLFCIWPALLRWSLRRQWPFATAIFTNLGTGLDNVPLPECAGRKVCGDLVFEGGAGAGPIRPDTRVSCAVHTYAGRMAICVRCDPRFFPAAQREEIAEAYLAALRTTIRTGT